MILTNSNQVCDRRHLKEKKKNYSDSQSVSLQEKRKFVIRKLVSVKEDDRKLRKECHPRILYSSPVDDDAGDE